MLPIFPDQTVLPGLAFNVKWIPNFFNLPTATSSTGADVDLALADTPLHDYELNYEFLHDQSWRSLQESLEFKTLFGFFLQMGGTVGRFVFENPDDFQVFQQSFATGDGSTTTFVLKRFFGANGFGATEEVGVVNTNLPFNIYLGGSSVPLNPSLYTTDFTLPVVQKVTFNTAPGVGVNIAVDMSYYYYCKFPANTNTFEKFMYRLWTVNSLIIHSCRAGT